MVYMILIKNKNKNITLALVTPSTSVPILYEECHGYDDVIATSAVFTSHPVSS